MNKLYLHGSALREGLFTALGVCLLLYFIFHAVQGQRGLIRLLVVKQEIATIAAMSDQVSADRSVLETRVAMFRPGSVDKDLLDERVRSVLGYKYNDEYSVLSY